eukprot:813920-Rhodomonas_salina.3
MVPTLTPGGRSQERQDRREERGEAGANSVRIGMAGRCVHEEASRMEDVMGGPNASRNSGQGERVVWSRVVAAFGV